MFSFNCDDNFILVYIYECVCTRSLEPVDLPP